jgi:hypothetical protein
VWARREVHALLDTHTPDAVALRIADPGGRANSLPRAELDGVVQEATAARGVAMHRLYGSTVRGAFSANKAGELDAALAQLPVTSSTPKSRRDPVVAAVAKLPATVT